ncbi:putative nuclear hormone receptor HR3 [Araneus ventricosus]|uniref:Putative nuclear hormone receptor HR3 n=1 Tax=Araneus ventricosus TaxID=182803 RepID=A0A4Y2MB49_ARAVE|nr:putative nuclear hormone receptor HR3 [Araneus ventricosus]
MYEMPAFYRIPRHFIDCRAFLGKDHEQLWLDCAQKLTNIIQQIIEFAKMVPGFMKLSQDDQILLLKAGSFEMSVLRMSRYLDITNLTCTEVHVIPSQERYNFSSGFVSKVVILLLHLCSNRKPF